MFAYRGIYWCGRPKICTPHGAFLSWRIPHHPTGRLAVEYVRKAASRLIVPHLTRLIGNLSKPGLHDAVVRNTLRLLLEIKIPKRYHGKLMNACFQYNQTPGVAIAIRAFAITILHQLSDTYPEILPELRLVIDQRIPTGSAAIRQRASKIKYGM